MPQPPSRYVAGSPRPNWVVAQVEGCPFGQIIGAICPGVPPEAVLDVLRPEEKAYAFALPTSERRREWIGGRLCLAKAISLYSTVRPPMLPTAWGAPTAPGGIAASISHKGPLALAIAASTDGGLGVDVDCVSSRDVALGRKVLTSCERGRLDAKADWDEARYVLAHFSLKEAVYKCLPPAEQVELEFDEVEIILEALPERVWLTPQAKLLTQSSVVRTALFLDGEWVISAASCAPTA